MQYSKITIKDDNLKYVIRLPKPEAAKVLMYIEQEFQAQLMRPDKRFRFPKREFLEEQK